MHYTLRTGYGELSSGTRVTVQEVEGEVAAVVASVPRIHDRSYFDGDGNQRHVVEYDGLRSVKLVVPVRDLVEHGAAKIPRDRVIKRTKQDDVRKLVDREVTATVKGYGPKTPFEDAFVLGIYRPDRRLG